MTGRKGPPATITVRFSVRPGQGEPDDFDLGDMVWEGERGRVVSAGHVPDQGMMIHLSVALLLHQLGPLLSGKRRTLSYAGIGSSFRLDFRHDGKGFVSVASKGKPVGRVRAEDLAQTVLRAAEELAQEGSSSLPADSGARNDCLAAVREFRVTMEAMEATGTGVAEA
ncbi:hypothetical protein GCM10010497_38390 [Streptomyces cinereoruber]|uniref:Uncharacterized protein n=2 Tax=Streptomyces cinereoruber TaxID=67260 RepID=A0AAV4KMG1_9ACTN|nr:hypothetical protein CP977_17055 [Streptomyces cinereoruber]GGR32203.1 hypothetical protein GCM10010497_38390 [Streptomyces cinereoruber]